MVLNEWERVKMFRTVQDPMVGPRPKQAFMLPDLPNWEAWYHVASGAVYVKTDTGRRHIIGTGNLSSIELEKKEDGKIQDTRGTGKKTNDKKVSGAV